MNLMDLLVVRFRFVLAFGSIVVAITAYVPLKHIYIPLEYDFRRFIHLPFIHH